MTRKVSARSYLNHRKMAGTLIGALAFGRRDVNAARSPLAVTLKGRTPFEAHHLPPPREGATHLIPIGLRDLCGGGLSRNFNHQISGGRFPPEVPALP